MPTRTLYEVLEVAQSASHETIEAAYRSISERLKVRAARDPQGAALMGTALEEAYRTLSNDDLRKRYDARIAPRPVVAATSTVDDRPWIIRNWALLFVVVVLIVGAYGSYRYVQNKKEKAEIAKALKEKEELLAKQKAEQEQRQRLQSESQEARKKRIEEAQYQQWREQERQRGAAYAREESRQQVRLQQDAARQQRMEEMAKQQEEMQARARLEQDKRKLEQLQRENSRRY